MGEWIHHPFTHAQVDCNCRFDRDIRRHANMFQMPCLCFLCRWCSIYLYYIKLKCQMGQRKKRVHIFCHHAHRIGNHWSSLILWKYQSCGTSILQSWQNHHPYQHRRPTSRTKIVGHILVRRKLSPSLSLGSSSLLPFRWWKTNELSVESKRCNNNNNKHSPWMPQKQSTQPRCGQRQLLRIRQSKIPANLWLSFRHFIQSTIARLWCHNRHQHGHRNVHHHHHHNKSYYHRNGCIGI